MPIIFYMAEKNRKKSSRKNKTGIGIAIWLIVAIILVIVFMSNWTTIHNNLVKSGILNGQVIEKEEKPTSEKPKKETVSIKNENKSQGQVELKRQETEKPAETKPVEVKPVESKPAEVKTVDTKPFAEEKTESKSETSKPVEAEKPVEPKPVATTTVKICFVNIDSDGSVNYKMVSRSAPKDSPLASAINQLLAGPSFTTAAEKNCTSLIPRGTKLLGASVKDGVATLNFNDAFEINTEGMEGYLAQMNQVINTATEFSSIKSVQFLINGKKKEYLGSEGIWIGTPLGKGSL